MKATVACEPAPLGVTRHCHSTRTKPKEVGFRLRILEAFVTALSEQICGLDGEIAALVLCSFMVIAKLGLYLFIFQKGFK